MKAKSLMEQYGFSVELTGLHKQLVVAASLKVEARILSLLTDTSLSPEERKVKMESATNSVTSLSQSLGVDMRAHVCSQLLDEGLARLLSKK